MGDEWGGSESEAFDTGAATGETRNEGSFERGGRFAAVAADDEGVDRHYLGDGRPKAGGDVLGQFRPVSASQAIGAEPHRRLSAWCTAEPCGPS